MPRAKGGRMPGFLRHVFSSDGFLPHGHCFLWKPGLIWLHVSADVLIGLSYVAISFTFAYLVHRARRDISFHYRPMTARPANNPLHRDRRPRSPRGVGDAATP